MAVFVLDRRKRPLMPCSEKRARKLLACGRARVHRLAPFFIRIIDRTVDDCRLQPLTLKIDPGSRHTGAHDPQRLARILAQAKRPLKDAAAVNATRWALFNALEATGLPVTTGSGGLTKFNRSRLAVPKTHALDAACVGVTETMIDWQRPTLIVKATGRGSYRRTRLDAFGFPRGYLTRKKRIHGFQTGDRVIVRVPTGKKAGVHIGRVAVRASGSFNLQTAQGVIQGISHRYCKVVQRADGYDYTQASATAIPPRPEGWGFSRRNG